MSLSRRERLVRGGIAGIVSTVVALATAELVAAIAREFRSPVVDVGSRVIDAAPRWLKDFAISTFDTSDKTALLVGIGALLGLYAVGIGVVSMAHPRLGVAGVGLFAVIGVFAATTGPTATTLSWVPSVVGGLAGGATLWHLAGLAATPDSVDPDPRHVPAPPRRTFLLAGGALTGAAVIAATTGRWLAGRFDVAMERAGLVLPRARLPLPAIPDGVGIDGVSGLTPFVTPNAEFYRIDTALTVPQIPVDDWTLRIRGMVDSPLELSFAELTSMDGVIESDITLTCVSNEVGGRLAGNARWLGIRLKALLDRVGVHPDADQVVGRSVDGFTAGFPVDAATDERGSLVAFGMNGEPLPLEHGYPVRLIVPGLYGYVSATKWLTEIELTRFDRFDAYWVERDWSAEGPIKTFSRIDTPGPLATIVAGRTAVAGVAWAQPRGISKVEVRVDGGPWAAARLAAALNDVTWRQWMFPVDLTPGRHTLECRATDGAGDTQPEVRSQPFPDGATGWHSVVVIAG